jgi:hypothetical protein
MHQNKSGTVSAWQTPTGYAASHCRQCAAGWTRIGTEGGVLTVCLLDREPVLAGMTSCDRYEMREQAPKEAAA